MGKALIIIGIVALSLIFLVSMIFIIFGVSIFWIFAILDFIGSAVWLTIYLIKRKNKEPEKNKPEQSILPASECVKISLREIISEYAELITDSPIIKRQYNSGMGKTTPIYRTRVKGDMKNLFYDVLVNQTNPSQFTILVDATEPMIQQAINDMAMNPVLENRVQTTKTIDEQTMQPIYTTIETKPRDANLDEIKDMMLKITNKETKKEEI